MKLQVASVSSVRACQHEWERRADLDGRFLLLFACRVCGVLGHRELSTRTPVIAYRDGRTNLACEFDEHANPEKRVYTNRHGSARWLGRELGE